MSCVETFYVSYNCALLTTGKLFELRLCILCGSRSLQENVFWVRTVWWKEDLVFSVSLFLRWQEAAVICQLQRWHLIGWNGSWKDLGNSFTYPESPLSVLAASWPERSHRGELDGTGFLTNELKKKTANWRKTTRHRDKLQSFCFSLSCRSAHVFLC